MFRILSSFPCLVQNNKLGDQSQFFDTVVDQDEGSVFTRDSFGPVFTHGNV